MECPNCKLELTPLGHGTWRQGDHVVGTDSVYQCKRCYYGVAIPHNES